MTRLSEKYEPLDVLALVGIVLCLVARMIKNDPVFMEVLKSVVMFYFGRKTIKTTEK